MMTIITSKEIRLLNKYNLTIVLFMLNLNASMNHLHLCCLNNIKIDNLASQLLYWKTTIPTICWSNIKVMNTKGSSILSSICLKHWISLTIIFIRVKILNDYKYLLEWKTLAWKKQIFNFKHFQMHSKKKWRKNGSVYLHWHCQKHITLLPYPIIDSKI